ncbi:hypothetical protein [Haloplasma contractile]|uniref:Uncharacterized protein n=1 Tax=Haloplasma contractile SSD-17B TaxID=1033810 RepID=U2FHX2_9MOLU|nr:hypothetical protein [Haloplasma contractile]ERJ12420.1 hypothetical protein HLPCO_001406 [Haloplasma contractile SSD-17B]
MMSKLQFLQSQQPVTNLNELFNKVQLNSISTYELIAGMSISFILGLLIFIIYRITFKGTVYSYTFNLSLLL